MKRQSFPVRTKDVELATIQPGDRAIIITTEDCELDEYGSPYGCQVLRRAETDKKIYLWLKLWLPPPRAMDIHCKEMAVRVSFGFSMKQICAPENTTMVSFYNRAGWIATAEFVEMVDSADVWERAHKALNNACRAKNKKAQSIAEEEVQRLTAADARIGMVIREEEAAQVSSPDAETLAPPPPGTRTTRTGWPLRSIQGYVKQRSVQSGINQAETTLGSYERTHAESESGDHLDVDYGFNECAKVADEEEAASFLLASKAVADELLNRGHSISSQDPLEPLVQQHWDNVDRNLRLYDWGDLDCIRLKTDVGPHFSSAGHLKAVLMTPRALVNSVDESQPSIGAVLQNLGVSQEVFFEALRRMEKKERDTLPAPENGETVVHNGETVRSLHVIKSFPTE